MIDQKAPVGRKELIESLQTEIHRCLQRHVDDAPFAMLDFPDIRNCGDSAIWLGEISYFQGRHGKTPSYVSRKYDFSADDLKSRVGGGTIYLQGGGTFGDVWGAHQDFREMILERFPDNKIVQLPQSIQFLSEGRMDQAARIISGHRNFTLLVRDRRSFDLAASKFDCEVELCPDMAVHIGSVERPMRATLPVLAMLRDDPEASARGDESSLRGIPVEDWVTERKFPVRLAKARGVLGAYLRGRSSDVQFHKLDAAARQRFDRGVRHLSKAKAIVTDRLHVHIVSLLLGIPHAVLDNNYGKVRGFITAFSGGTDLTYLPDNMAEAVAWAKAQAGETDRAR